MSEAKAAKLLSKALNNSSKEEAITAFSMAFSQAQRAGVSLSDLYTVPEAAAPISEDRERELVTKYNTLLVEAKRLRQERDDAARARDEWFRRWTVLAEEADGGEAARKLERLKKYIKRL